MSRRVAFLLAGCLALTLAGAACAAAAGAQAAPRVRALVGGHGSLCAIMDDRTVRCVGVIASGLTPVTVAGLTDVEEVVLGTQHACARIGDGTVRCWGDNGVRQLGDGTTRPRAAPVTVRGVRGATQLATRGSHTCALVERGRVQCWGANDEGVLGVPPRSRAERGVVTVPDVEGATAIASVAPRTMCATISPTRLRCWGGGATADARAAPPEEETARACGCAVAADGAVRCHGSNDSGQLGQGTTGPMRFDPVVVGSVRGARALACTSWLSGQWAGPALERVCAIDADRAVWCWGARRTDEEAPPEDDAAGRARFYGPARVEGLGPADQLVMGTNGEWFACVRQLDGEARCWGTPPIGARAYDAPVSIPF